MNEIIEKATKIANDCASKLSLNILDVDYVFEHGIKILRIIANGSEGLTIDQSSELNQLISDELDKDDFIDEEYYLEVSSPGLEMPLKTDEDITNAVGSYINIKTFEKIEKLKELNGDLLSYENGILKMNVNIRGIEKIIEIERKKISKLRLAVKF